MATQVHSAAEAQPGDGVRTDVAGGLAPPQMLIVDFGKRQSLKKIKDLRKGRGKLLPHVESIVQELIQSGTVSANAQPIIIVVREEAEAPWPFS